MTRSIPLRLLAVGLLISACAAEAQHRPQKRDARGGPPPMRQHTAIQTAALSLIPATEAPIAPSRYSERVEGDARIVTANGVAPHPTGAFPNSGNPHRIAVQRLTYRLPLAPTRGTPTHFRLGLFGVAVTGVKLEPQAAEFWRGERGSDWQYDPLGGAIRLGLDAHTAHVQPDGGYHYHGLPGGLLEEVALIAGRHSPLVGWAMDGHPIYALYGRDGETMTSSWRLKQGARPGGRAPGGRYDGTFTNDYDYVAGSGTLDACNGAWTVSPELPNGGYAYFLTTAFPVIPRCFTGTPIAGAIEMDAAGRRVAGR